MLGIALLIAAQTTTTCIPLGGQMTCTSQTPQPYAPPPPITQVDIPRIAREARSSGPRPESFENSFQEELARRMGILARQQRCEDAYRLAALAGEPELADASRRLCPFTEAARP